MSVKHRVAEGKYLYLWYICGECHKTLLIKFPVLNREGVTL